MLLERRDDLRVGEALLYDAREGRGCLLLVEGPAGIGKSAVIGELRSRAISDGCAVLSARGAELERDFSYGVVRQLLEPALAAATPEERRGLLSGAARLAEPAIGELTVGVDPEPSSASPSRDPSFAVLHGLYWLTANLAERSPLLVCVDDAHWADAASLRFLAYLAGRLAGMRALLVVGVRRFEPGAPAELIAAIAAEQSAHEMRLSPLTAQATDALVRSRLSTQPADGFSAACHRATGGNPQLIRELLAALAAEGIEPTPAGAEHVATLRADRIAGSVLARLGRVGAPAVAAAQAVAVLGREAMLELVARLAGLDPDEAAGTVESLVALEVLAPGEPIAFVHPIVRAAVYADLGVQERGDSHARAARLLAARGAGLDSVAAQIVATPPSDDGWAVSQLRMAARAALASGAPDATVAYLERALEESPSPEDRRDALLDLGRALFMLRDPRRSIHRLLEALELTEDPRRRAEIVDILVAGMLVSRAAAQAVELLHRAIEALPESECELGVRLESDIDSGSFFSLNAKRCAQRRRRRFTDPDDPRMIARAAMIAALYGGTAAEAGRLGRRAVGGGRLLRDGGPDSPPVWTAGFALLYAHRLSEARELADEWIREARRHGSMRAYSLASSLRTRATYWSGELIDAEADARAFIEGMPEALALGPAFLADTLIDQGKLREAADALALAARADTEVEWSFFYPSLLLTRGMLAIRRGALADGCEILLEAGRVADEWGVRTPGPFQWRAPAAEALSSLGEPGQARELIDAELTQCRRYGSARSMGIALRVAGLLDGGPRGIEQLQEAVRLLETSEARLEHARALIDLGCALRRARRASRGSDAAAGRSRDRARLRRAPACGARARGADRHRGAAAQDRPGRGRGAHLERDTRCTDGRRRYGEQGHRPGAVRHGAHRRGASASRLPEARHHFA